MWGGNDGRWNIEYARYVDVRESRTWLVAPEYVQLNEGVTKLENPGDRFLD